MWPPDRDSSNAIDFFPDWGHRWPLWGGQALDQLDLPLNLVARLEAWTRVWQEVLDPVDGVRWPDPAVGAQWIIDGDMLLKEVRSYAAKVGLTVQASFHEYAP